MSKFLLPVLILIWLSACERQEDGYFEISGGTYTGTFQREMVWSESDTANITLVFSANKWSGTGDHEKYPALCHGTYSVNGDTIDFTNECVWTADFDWSLILHGKYRIIMQGDGIEFYKDYRSATSDTYVDRYKIKRQEE